MKRLATSGGELAYVDEGAGPPVVLLHGFPTSSYMWRDVVPALADRMRVIAPDLLGYGESDKPDDQALNPRAQARYVRELLEQLEIREFGVVGHDVGGGVAQLLALEARVRAMVLLDSVAFDAWPIEGVRLLQEAGSQDATPEFVASVIELALGLGSAREGGLDERDLAAYRLPFATADGAHAFFRAARGIDGLGLAGRERDLGRLDVPTLLIWGEDDPYLGPELGERLADLLPQAALVLLPGCSHLVTEDAPETVVALISQFLRSKYLGLPHSHEHGDGHGHAPTAGPTVIRLERRGPT